MGPKPNQAFLDLKQHIILENKISIARHDSKLQATTLLCTNCFSQEEIKQQIKSLLDEFTTNFTDSINISSAYDYTLLYYLAIKNKQKVPCALADYMNSTVFKAIETPRFKNYKTL